MQIVQIKVAMGPATALLLFLILFLFYLLISYFICTICTGSSYWIESQSFKSVPMSVPMEYLWLLSGLMTQ